MTVSKATGNDVFQERARQLAAILYDKRGEDVRLLDVRGLCSYADYLVIGTAASQPQMRGMSKDMAKYMSEEKAPCLGESGIREGNWALVDFGDIVVHIFTPESREFYQLDEMWGDAPEVDIPLRRKSDGADE